MQFLLLIVAVVLVRSKGDHGFSLCNGVNDNFGVTKIHSHPSNIVPGRHFKITVSGTTVGTIIYPKCTMGMDIGGYKKSFHPCDQNGVNCPMAPGTPWSIELEFPVPSSARALLGHKVQFTMKCYDVEEHEGGEVEHDMEHEDMVTCLSTSAKISLRSPNPMAKDPAGAELDESAEYLDSSEDIQDAKPAVDRRLRAPARQNQSGTDSTAIPDYWWYILICVGGFGLGIAIACMNTCKITSDQTVEEDVWGASLQQNIYIDFEEEQPVPALIS